MQASQIVAQLQELIAVHGDQVALIDDGMHLREVEDIDLGASDEGIIIWSGAKVEE
jgi:hypothetical protein